MTEPVAISIGNFDGVHCGHRRLIAEARDAVGAGGRVIVLSFEPHPASVLRPGAEPARLSSFEQRVELLTAAGADHVSALVPTRALLAQSPDEFVASIVARYAPTCFVEGGDFRFGRGRAGSVATLRELEGVHGYTTRVLEPVSAPLCNRQLAVSSSSMIRWLIDKGRVGDAEALLGRPYELRGAVVPGDRRGRAIGVPTANIDTADFQLPADGIYAGRACRAGAEDAWFPAAISVGTKPTFGASARACEAHLVGYDGPLDDYGWTIRLEVGEWLRDQIRYDDVDLLVEQIRRDIAQTEARGRRRRVVIMEPYESNTTWPEIAERLRRASRVALTTHERPDGDALGSVLALERALRHLGTSADAIIMGPIERPLLPLAAATPIHLVEERPPDDAYDAIVVVDTGAWSQLEPLAAWLGRAHEKTIVIDHHRRGDDVGALRFVDPEAAAAAELVVALLDELGCPLSIGRGAWSETGGVAEALFAGIATDTGWFRYSNAGPRALELAARLMRCGADKGRLYQLIEETYRVERLALEARALASIECVRDGTVAIQTLVRRDFEETGTTLDDLTSVVNLPMKVGTVRVAILLAEIGATRTKASFRAKPAAGSADDGVIDVNRLAQRFGGGGHVFAAGARIDLPLVEARAAVVEAVEGI